MPFLDTKEWFFIHETNHSIAFIPMNSEDWLIYLLHLQGALPIIFANSVMFCFGIRVIS